MLFQAADSSPGTVLLLWCSGLCAHTISLHFCHEPVCSSSSTCLSMGLFEEKMLVFALACSIAANSCKEGQKLMQTLGIGGVWDCALVCSLHPRWDF